VLSAGQLLSATRFVALIPRLILPLAVDLQPHLGACTGISFVDATTAVGWFYGFKLHRVVNDRGEVLAFCLTAGKTDDRRPLPRLARRLFGKLVGDRGSIAQALAERLFVTQGRVLITKLRKTRRERLLTALTATDKLLLRKRAISERVTDQLKQVCPIEHTRQRSPYHFLARLLARLVAYCHQPKKPSRHLDRDLALLAAG
jgi:hypothetical protein